MQSPEIVGASGYQQQHDNYQPVNNHVLPSQLPQRQKPAYKYRDIMSKTLTTDQIMP